MERQRLSGCGDRAGPCLCERGAPRRRRRVLWASQRGMGILGRVCAPSPSPAAAAVGAALRRRRRVPGPRSGGEVVGQRASGGGNGRSPVSLQKSRLDCSRHVTIWRFRDVKSCGNRDGDFGGRSRRQQMQRLAQACAAPRPPPLHHTPQRSKAGARGSSAPPAALLVACQPMRQTALPRCEARSAKPPEPRGSGCHTPRAAVTRTARNHDFLLGHRAGAHPARREARGAL